MMDFFKIFGLQVILAFIYNNSYSTDNINNYSNSESNELHIENSNKNRKNIVEQFNIIYERIKNKENALQNFLGIMDDIIESITKNKCRKIEKRDPGFSEIKNIDCNVINVKITINEYFAKLLGYKQDTKISIINFLEDVVTKLDSLYTKLLEYKTLSENNSKETIYEFTNTIKELISVFDNIKNSSVLYEYCFKYRDRILTDSEDKTIIDNIIILNNKILTFVLKNNKSNSTNEHVFFNNITRMIKELFDYISSLSNSIRTIFYEIKDIRGYNIPIINRINKRYLTRLHDDDLYGKFLEYKYELKYLLDECEQIKNAIDKNEIDTEKLSSEIQSLQIQYRSSSKKYNISNCLILIPLEKPLEVKQFILQLICENANKLRLNGNYVYVDNKIMLIQDQKLQELKDIKVLDTYV